MPAGMLKRLFSEKEQQEILPPLRTHENWNEEKCYDAVQKCLYRSEFRDRFPGAVSYAERNGFYKELVKDLPELKIPEHLRKYKFCIYVYEDKTNKAAYVGLTNDIYRRNKQHSFNPDDSLYKWCKE